MVKSVLMATAFVAAVTASGTAGAANKFGAIAYSPSTGAHGWGNNYDTREIAEAVALQGCTAHAHVADCYIAVWVQNQCMSFAQGQHDGVKWPTGFAYDLDANLAMLKALEGCSAVGHGCKIVVLACAGT